MADNPNELYELGQSCLIQGNSQDAIKALELALSTGLDGYRVCEAQMLLSSAYMRTGDQTKCLEHFRKAESINDQRTGSLRQVLKQRGWL